MFFYGIEQVVEDPFSILKVWEGGLSFHGGLLGVIISFFLFFVENIISLSLNFQIISLLVFHWD